MQPREEKSHKSQVLCDSFWSIPCSSPHPPKLENLQHLKPGKRRRVRDTHQLCPARPRRPGELPAPTNLIRVGLINGSVIEVGDVVVGVAPVALGGVVGDAQVVKARQEHEDADDQHGDGPVGLLQGQRAQGSEICTRGFPPSHTLPGLGEGGGWNEMICEVL